MKNVIKYSFRTLLIVLLTAVLLFTAAFFLIQQPKVQTFVVRQVTNYLSNKIGSEVSIRSVDIQFFRTLQLNDVFVAGKKPGDTILYARELDVRLKFFDPFKSVYHFDNIALDGLVFYGSRPRNDSTYNFSYIIKALASGNKSPKDTSKKSDPVYLSLNQVQLTNTHLVLDDAYADHKFELRSKRVFIDVDKFNLDKLLIEADAVELDAPEFTFTMYNQKPKEKDTIPGKPFRPQHMGLTLNVDRIQMRDGLYAMNMENRDIHAGNFSISRMRCRNINLDFEDYRWDTTGMHVTMKALSTQLDNSIDVHHISGNVTLDDNQIAWNNAKLDYNETGLTGNLGLKFPNDWHDLSDFVNSVVMIADLEEVHARGEDVAQFAPAAAKYIPASATLTGKVRGKLNNLRIEKLYAAAGKHTLIDISGNIKGLPNINQTLFDLNINQVSTHSNELPQLISFLKLPKQLSNAGQIRFSGSYFGFFNDFVARGKLSTTNLGNAETDLRMSFKKGQTPSYDGIINGHQINLAELTGNHQMFGTADLNIDAQGQGFDLKTLNTRINGTVGNFYLNGFVFDKIDIAGQFDKKKFSGNAFFDDDCFLVDFNGSADFNDSLPKFDFATSVKNADLYKLNFTKDTIIISLDGEVHMAGNNFNNITGTGLFNNIILQNAKNMLALSDVNIDLENTGGIKDYTIRSNEIDVNIQGRFNPLTIYQSSKVFVSQYTNLFTPTAKDLKANEAQDLKANILLHTDFGGLFKVFAPKLHYLSELNLVARMNTETGLLEMQSKADSFNYDNIALSGIEMNANTRDKELQGDVFVNQLLYDKVAVNEIALGVTSSTEQLLTNLSVQHDTSDNAIRLLSVLNFKGDTILARILDSRLRLNRKDWIVEPGNSITLFDSVFITQNFNFRQGTQKISLQNGRNTFSDVKINVENLELADVAQIFDTTGAVSAGKLSGMVNLKNLLTKLQANADLTIKDLKVLDYQVDYIGLDGIYGRGGKKKAEIGGTIEDGDYQLSFDGTYDMTNKGKEMLDVSADIQRLNLKFIQDLIKNEVTIDNAYIRGQVKATGTLKKIALNGEAEFLDTARVKLRFLGAVFNIPKGEEVTMNNKGFDFGTMTIFDDFGNSALLSGKLNHSGFQQFACDNVILNATSGYNFMNTTFEENQDFFGKVFAKGNVLVDGPFDDLNITIDAQTLRNTVFNLPVTGNTSSKGYSYVKFFDPKDSTKVVEDKVKLSGLNILMNIDATPDAQVNIILDPSSNDMISGSGEGNLTMRLDKKGDLSLNGLYTLAEGNYDFRFQNIINKKFTVKKGSTIAFDGDPLKATLGIEALYTLKSVSLRNIDSTLRNTIPVDLNLLIGGTLEKPEINFKISTSTGGNISANSDKIQALLNEISNNKTEVNNQAFTLLLFNSFSKVGEIGATGTYSNTLTQFVSDQLSRFLTQGLNTFLKGASLDVLLSDLENKDSRQFGFSYKQELFNNRLIFTVGGNVNFGQTNAVDPLNNRSNAAFAGDFVLEYLLTQDGRIRLKTFARTANYDLINQDRIRTGGAFAIQKDFDRFEDLFTRQNKKEKKKAAQPTDVDSNYIQFK